MGAWSDESTDLPRVKRAYPDHPHGDAARAALIFSGSLAIYRHVDALQPLLALVTMPSYRRVQ